MIRIGLILLLCQLGLSSNAIAQQQTVFLIRHAEKSLEPGADPELSELGKARALQLVNIFSPTKTAAIFTSQYRRTQQTALPLANALGIAITALEINKDNAKQYTALLLERICALPDKSNVLVVGHSNSIPAIVSAWTGEQVADIADDEYDRLYMVRLDACHASDSLALRY